MKSIIILLWFCSLALISTMSERAPLITISVSLFLALGLIYVTLHILEQDKKYVRTFDVLGEYDGPETWGEALMGIWFVIGLWGLHFGRML